MKRLTSLFTLAVAALVLMQCEPNVSERTPDSGTVDFSSYVAVGNSLTAGYADNALHRDGQLNAFPAILAEQMKQAGGGDFFQPLVNPGVGSNADGQARLELRLVPGPDGQPTLSPQPAAADGQDIFRRQQTGPFNNVGVPGARIFHLVTPGYGNSAAGAGNFNRFFTRFKSDPMATVVGDAMLAEPTFFSLWIGNNDVLGYATSGGSGNPDGGIGGMDITPMDVFQQSLDGIIATLTAGGAKGVVLGIPDITTIPFFTTVPWNGLVLTAEQAGMLRAGFAAQLAAMGVPDEQIPALVPDFQAGQNGFLIADPETAVVNFRLATENDLILLSVPQDSLRTRWGSQVPIPNRFTLRQEQIQAINTATTQFNTALETAASGAGLVYVDMNPTLQQARTGLVFDGMLLSTQFVTGGLFSLDGVHLSPRGNAVVANGVIEAINRGYGATLSPVNISAYEGVRFP